MSRVNTGYARAFNARHDRTGYVFENRYKALPVERDDYVQALIRYVHLNPLRAGLVTSLDELDAYPWCGHATLTGRTETHFQDTRWVLERFGPDPATARVALRKWMREEPAVDGGAGPPGIAPGELARADQGGGASAPIADAPTCDAARAISGLVERVCKQRQVDQSELLGGVRRRRVAAARAEVVFRACSELGISGAEVGRLVGLTRAGVSQARARGRLIVRSGGDREEKSELLDLRPR